MRLNLEVLLILDALDKHGSFASAAESLFKTPAALSYMIQKLENDLNITLLDRSGHRAKFTDTGRMMLEKGRLLLNAAKDLEKQAVQLSAGWERDLAIALDDSFPFSALLPLIDAFYAQHPQTRLNFTHHTLAGSWEGHPLAETTQPLTNKQLSLHRAVVISDSARYCHPLNSNLLDEQPQIRVDDFASKVELLRAGLGCGFLPRHIARPWLEKGELVEKPVISCRVKDITYMAWRSGNDGLAQRWWREAILRSESLNQLYA